MKNLKLLPILFIILLSCNNNDNIKEPIDSRNQEEHYQEVSKILEQANNMLKDLTCNNPDDWSFISYGSKACGGPHGYIAYSNEINVELFKSLIEKHRKEEDKYNKRWNVMSTCDLPGVPKGIVCNNGKAQFNY
ncbi:hypothetical protein SAMN04489761_3112 [Tenacibaculum sp. MAR_2009_124]|uniref:hypothetical protein n=1 Tax=Tenacibaculum sp. MAR_2009_124 TaxID=1250059 RepID=UPI00089AA4C4|nr:hypothetical protein [Tenacibaculum sp. MAR_2009_124]SEC48104.1 hypothetical protein SAMN04489761_3112 [Tenacibaculum sp. MAR_2009_124]